MNEMTKKNTITVALDSDLYNAVEVESERKRTSKATIVRQAIDVWMKDEKKESITTP